PAKTRRRLGGDESGAALPGDPNAWLARAVEHPGSWWPDWTQWLAGHAGKQVAARRKLGSKKYAPIEPAPGRYVKVRAV
ncbi:class I poly(R)-hydroxyalkanoic acid synthase, partial [Bordetella hinzii]|nr:class I poly(R)-hydroxyalkanoic acid synthase [Bordetella hinzii]